jgi:pyruvate-formate lyase-activating enzyme/TusA-related sulfurtransferase
MSLTATIELEAKGKTFATGFLPELIAALRAVQPGDLLAVVGDDAELASELKAWCRFTRNSLVEEDLSAGRPRWTIRCGEADLGLELDRPIGSRLWLYTNFDCNLQCDYCCVRSSPRASRRPLGADRVRRIAGEAAELDVKEIFVTGGEPFMLPDIGDILAACATAAPTTVLTNGMLLKGRRLDMLRQQSPSRLTLQVSIDSATAERHDRHRGAGSWARAWDGIARARAHGFRVRIAATVSEESEEAEFRRFLDVQQVAEEDRVIRRIALRGFAEDGIAIARADLMPEITITESGVYWHPVGADDVDLLVTRDIFPLAGAFAAVRRAFDQDRAHQRRLASIFNCA